MKPWYQSLTMWSCVIGLIGILTVSVGLMVDKITFTEFIAGFTAVLGIAGPGAIAGMRKAKGDITFKGGGK